MKISTINSCSLALLFSTAILTSCGKGGGGASHGDGDKYVGPHLPAVLEMVSVETEAGPTKDDLKSYKFKVVAKPKENLYLPVEFGTVLDELVKRGLKPAKNNRSTMFGGENEYPVGDLKSHTYIRKIQSSSDRVTLYGTVVVKALLDKEEVQGIEFESGTKGMGKPIHSFAPDSVDVNSSTYDELLNEWVATTKAKNEAEEKRIADEAASKAAVEAEAKKMEEKRKSEILQSLAPGSTFSGYWKCQAGSGEINMEVIENKLDGGIIKLKFTLPEGGEEMVVWSGNLDFKRLLDKEPLALLQFFEGKAIPEKWGDKNSTWNNLFNSHAEMSLDLISGEIVGKVNKQLELHLKPTKR